MDTTYNLSFQNLNYHVNSLNPLKRTEPKQILKSVCGEFRSNELSAIVGLSGSGKSSLLDCLSGFQKKNVNGVIMLNGIPVSTSIIRQISSYVMQEATMHPLLTAEELLSLSINLRDKSRLDSREKQSKIKSIMEKMNIIGRCDTYIRDLSGGERKRVQVAAELVIDPTILFLDECTTGLDSFSSFQCVQMLQKLAKDGRTVICSIHQPSASMLQTFDYIYGLADGNCIYSGAGAKLIPFLKELDLPCPATYNPADFLVELANNDYGIHNHRLITKIQNGSNSEYRNAEKCNNSGNMESLAKLKTDLSSHPTKYSQSYASQVYYLMHRLFLITLRDPSLFYIRFFVHIFVGAIFGYIYKDVGNKGEAIFDNYRYLVISVVFLLYTSYHSLFTAFPLEFPIIKREHFNGWYSTRAYYSAFMIFDLPITLLCCVSYISITYWLTDQPRELNRFLLFLCFGIFMSYAAQSVAVMITALMSVKLTTILGTFFLTPFFLFSGVMVTTKDVNKFFGILFYGNFLDCGLKGVVNSVLGFNRNKMECDEMYCHYGDPKKLMRDLGAETNLIIAFCTILAYIVVCQLASFMLFRFRLKHRLS